MRLWANVYAKVAVMAGRSQSGVLPVDLTDEQISSLTEAERQALADEPTLGREARERSDWRTPAGGGGDPPYLLTAPTFEEVRAYLAAKVARAAKDAAEAEERRRKAVIATAGVLAKRETKATTYKYAWHANCGNARVGYLGCAPAARGEVEYVKVKPAWPDDCDTDIMGSPEAQAWIQSLNDANTAAEMQAKEEATRMANEAAAEQRAEAERELQAKELYRTAAREQVRLVNPEATCTPRAHTATCGDCNTKTTRHSVLVEIVWHGRTFSREFAL